MNMPFLVCKNYISSEKASFIIKKPSTISKNDEADQNEQGNNSQNNENSTSNNLEIIDYPYYLNYREKEVFPFDADKLIFQNFKEFEDITDETISQNITKNITKNKCYKQGGALKEQNSSSSLEKNNQNIYRKILKNKIINKNNSPINKTNINFDKIFNSKISKKTNSKNSKLFKSKIEKKEGIQINCPSPDSYKPLLNYIHKYNSQISSKKTKKKIKLINNSNSINNQKVKKINLKINSNFSDFNKNKVKEKKENTLNFIKLSKNKNRTYNTLTMNNKKRTLKLKKIDKINNNAESNKSQKVKYIIEKNITNNDIFQNKKFLDIMPILKKEKSSDCIQRKKSKQHILYDNHNNFHKTNKINNNGNYNTIQIIKSQRNKKNNTVLKHILKIQNNNYSVKTYINPFDREEKRVIRNLKDFNLNKTKKH